jgi:hypothetical protein
MVKGADSARRVFAGAPEGSELALRAFTYFGGRALYDARAALAQISAVIGELRPAPSRGFHRVSADLAARPHLVD